ncbi:MAG: SAM-dependent chlorinase/fluorinase [Planctomycetes bacterium]|nr:SAM-dependent chlorinase/fluorinase [Planctomycetota bacterium]
MSAASVRPADLITLTTDFGAESPYVAAMKGVILSHNRWARIVDLSHGIPPQDILAGALALDQASRWFPPGTIHVAVVDPGVGTARRIVCAEIAGQWYVGPDNGLFSCLAQRTRPTTIVAVEDRQFWLPQVSHTFHGRDIMAPVVARLSLGLDPLALGPRLESLVMLNRREVVVVPGKIVGAVAAIDSFGNLITDIAGEALKDAPTDERLQVECDEHQTTGLYQTYGDQPAMTLMALIGSSGFLELAIVEDSAAIMLGVKRGSKVTVTW